MRRKLSAAKISTDLPNFLSLLGLTRWALALSAAAAPLYVVRWRLGPAPTTLLEVLILATLGLYALTLIRHRAPLPRRTPYDIPIALFLLAGAVAIFVAPDHRGALGIFRAYLLEPVAIYYVVAAVFETTEAQERLLAVWGAGTILFAVDEVVVVLRAYFSGGLIPGHAAAAFDINPNSVAMYLEPLLGVAAGFALFGRGRKRWLALAFLAFIVPAELATLSRGGLLALGVLAVIAVLTVSSWPLRIALAVGAVVGAVLIRFLPVVGSRAAGVLTPMTGTFFGRVGIWVVTLRMLRDRPVFGAGLNAYQTVVAPYRAVDSQLSPEPYPHNILLTTWSELGLLGLASFVYILGSLIVRPWRAFSRATGATQPLLWGLGAAFAMIAVHGMVDSVYWKNDMSLEFWVLAGLQVVTLRLVAGR
jgi:O-antigen ligase